MFIIAVCLDIVMISCCHEKPTMRSPLPPLSWSSSWPHCTDEIDAIGTKRYDSHSGGEREIQRTMLELLNQMDGFDAMGDVKVRCALYAWNFRG